jgi:hypothetical protein
MTRAVGVLFAGWRGAGFPREGWLGDFDFDANPNVYPATIHTPAKCGCVR